MIYEGNVNDYDDDTECNDNDKDEYECNYNNKDEYEVNDNDYFYDNKGNGNDKHEGNASDCCLRMRIITYDDDDLYNDYDEDNENYDDDGDDDDDYDDNDDGDDEDDA